MRKRFKQLIEFETRSVVVTCDIDFSRERTGRVYADIGPVLENLTKEEEKKADKLIVRWVEDESSKL